MLLIVQICVFLLLNMEIPVSCQLPSEDGTSVGEPFPQQKCESLLANCSCYDYDIVYGIICNRMEDFSNFAHLLSSDAIFDVTNVTTYEITFSVMKHLPARIFEGLTVYRLFLEDPEMTSIDENAFQGVKRLRRFHVRQSQIKKIPDFRIISNSIRKISIDSSGLTALEGTGLQNLPLLERLAFVNNSIRFIDPDLFKGTEEVTLFDISYNLLTFLPPNLLNNWKKMKKFVASYNNLLHVDQLFAFTHPRFIFLEYNNITEIDKVLHYNMRGVETVVLAGNPIENISENSFNGKVPEVRFLYLDHCRIHEFKATHYKDLSILATLDLNTNLIESVSRQKIEFGKHVEINFIGNQISKFDADISHTVKRLYLNENKLKSLGVTLHHTQIDEVSIARNQIQYLMVKDLHGVHKTRNLELQGNEIELIDRDTFETLRNDLHYLDLSSNIISSLNGSVIDMSTLKLLNLTDNLIESFDSMEFKGLNELSELYLQNNRIIALGGQLQQLYRLQYLVVVKNNIEVLRVQQLPKSVRFIYLAENPLKCDCYLLPFLLWLNASDSHATDVDLCLPPDVKNNSLEEVSRCPATCSCRCREDGGVPYMSVDCSSQNLSFVPSFLTNNFETSQDYKSMTIDIRRTLLVEQDEYPSLQIQDHVLRIDLENNSLESLEAAQMPRDLIHLRLSHNKLRLLPQNIMDDLQNLKRVTLSGNPWNCDCKALSFKQWLLFHKDKVEDINATRCGGRDKGELALSGKVIFTLSDLDLCPKNIGMIVLVALGVLVFLTLCLATKILYTKFELNVRVFLYSHGITFVKQTDRDSDKEYDAFISFSNDDEVFVTNEIISVIENKNPNIRLCIHYRHFKPGEYIHDNIIHAIRSSKRTILILSASFLESKWCIMEFKAAHEQSIEDKVHRIIVIKVGKLPDDIDPTIKVYLNSTTYLTWHEKYFWNNLMYILPSSSAERNPHPQRTVLEMQEKV